MPSISEAEFMRLRDWLHEATGIHMTVAKMPLVTSRLAKRLREHQLGTYTQYLRMLVDSAEERQAAIDLLTTNETYFFRETPHFDFLARLVPTLPAQRPVRIWSAACSTGEEPYSIAMLLASVPGLRGWEVLASDVSSRVLDVARAGQYRMERARQMPHDMLTRYCLKGTGRHEGTLLVQRSLRERVRFEQVNLNAPLPDVGEFDLIFLRNVMIYFDTPTKRGIVERLVHHLRPGGHFIIGHSESLNDVTRALRPIMPSVYTTR